MAMFILLSLKTQSGNKKDLSLTKITNISQCSSHFEGCLQLCILSAKRQLGAASHLKAAANF